jgi:hypothetical protein
MTTTSTMRHVAALKAHQTRLAMKAKRTRSPKIRIALARRAKAYGARIKSAEAHAPA